jgi:hypothetical protein
MSFIIDAWRADGNGECALASMRCNRRAEFTGFVARWKMHPACVLITKTYSSRKRANVEYLWIREGYTSSTVSATDRAIPPVNAARKRKKGACPCCGQPI